MSAENPMSYGSTGVRYDLMDPVKKLAQMRARSTSVNLQRFMMDEVVASRGESAFVWEEPDSYRAFVIEGLGTKNKVADSTRKITGKTHYDTIAQDTVAMIVNDLVVVGARPQVLNAYFAVGSSEWFNDEERARDLVNGWADASNKAGVVWGGGETPTLKGIIEPDSIDLSGAAVGMIKPKEQLTLGDKLTPGDSIILVESNGIHANGLTLARGIAEHVAYERSRFRKHFPMWARKFTEKVSPVDLAKGYEAELSDGNTYGESLLAPTHIYAGLTEDLYDAGVDIHYMVNVTGHGWRKLMRADRELTYVIDRVPKPQPVFQFIQEKSGNDDREMYGNFNMNAGFAIMAPLKDVGLIREIARDQHNMRSIHAGYVEEGPKRVVIRPKDIIFEEKSLSVR